MPSFPPSSQPKLAKAIMEARRAGDAKLAQELCDEMNELATLRFDPTDPEGIKKNEQWDVEAWYYEARKRVYGIIM